MLRFLPNFILSFILSIAIAVGILAVALWRMPELLALSWQWLMRQRRDWRERRRNQALKREHGTSSPARPVMGCLPRTQCSLLPKR